MFETLSRLLSITRSYGIVRRYFVVNGFDGTLTMLGLITGFYVSEDVEISIIINACLGAAIALGVSGITSAYVSEAAKAHPDRFLGFGWADPNIGPENAMSEAKKCLYDYDLYGVKLNGAQNEYFLDDEAKTFPIIEEVAKAGKMLAFHCGADHYIRTHPYQIAKIAKAFPDTQILCVHMGGAGMPDLSRAAIELAQEHANVALIGSAIGHTSIWRALACFEMLLRASCAMR